MFEEALRDWLKSAREEGRHEGRQEGHQEGEVKGRRDTVLRVLAQRFGKLPQQVRRKVAALESVAELERLLDRALTARSLEELRFG